MRDSMIRHALLICAMQVQLFVSRVTYRHRENAEHLSAALRESVPRLGRTYVALVDLANSRLHEYEVSRMKFVVPG